VNPASGTGLRIPSRVATFRLGGRRDYEDRALGIQLRYLAADSLYADVYLYPGPDFGARCDSLCAAEALAREVAQFQAEFPEFLNRKYFDSIAVSAVDTLTPGPERPWRLGQHLRLAVTRAGKPARSDFYLFYLPRYRVKVRFTYEPTLERTEAADAFIRDLVPSLVGVPPKTPPRE
jgi:hypothetical protein